ncbi:hypothetical protein OZX56_08505 [Lactobacillus sp. ESL0684]|uniref:hypothetical protein n=1 Tax=Lactobacillus sp. ESL0684 TaxID=2983213 RepID=UPI0023F808EC|nr:hypothetical protein [Lactobacillus sp. ESL0684]WEV43529.1 hypothetical protein OZX56_08505 [Lactobacillus sp. ESL0684]
MKANNKRLILEVIYIAVLAILLLAKVSNIYTICAIGSFLVSMIETIWLPLKEEIVAKQLGSDVLNCLRLQMPALVLLISLTTENNYAYQQTMLLPMILIILVNLVCIVLVDYCLATN